MIVFIFFRLLVFVYGFEKHTIDVLSGFFALFSFVEFVAVAFVAVAHFREIVTFMKGLKKESKGLEK